MYNVDWNKIEKELSDIPDKEINRSVVSDVFARHNLSKADFMITDIVQYLSNIKPVMGENGKYSPLLTLKGIPPVIETVHGKIINLKGFVKLLYKYSRSNLFASTPPNMSALVPLVLKAMKVYYNINYEDWDKSDEYIRVLLGFRLYDIVGHTNKDFPYSADTRKKIVMVITSGQLKPYSGYPTQKSVSIGKEKYKSTYIPVMIRFQLWNAHASKRDEYMILDLDDWDKMPEPLDVVDFNTQSNKKVASNSYRTYEDLPF